ncbi:MAG: hypothetical protein V8T41_00815 [Oscillospiraceae bacterium]
MANYDSGAFNADRFDILASMPEKNVGLIVDPGCDLESSRAAIALAEKYDFVYAAVGAGTRRIWISLPTRALTK